MDHPNQGNTSYEIFCILFLCMLLLLLQDLFFSKGGAQWIESSGGSRWLQRAFQWRVGGDRNLDTMIRSSIVGHVAEAYVRGLCFRHEVLRGDGWI